MSIQKDEVHLRPQLNLFDAIATGLAAILGAGIFAVIAPAAAIAGPTILVSLGIAAFVALCNALSSAQLARVFPRSGGTYEFGRRMMGEWWGYGAGWMFLTANTLGPGVIALAFASYLSAVFTWIPVRLAAVLAAVIMTAINALGIRRSVHVTDVIVIVSILSLIAVVVIGLPAGRVSNLSPLARSGVVGTLQATGLLFFAYTGYSRIATLVEEVRNARHTIPRATIIALGTATMLYLLVAGTAIAVLGASGVAGSTSPLEQTMIVVGSSLGMAIVALGALVTTFNEGLSDLLGVSRVAFAMGRGKDLPTSLAHLSSDRNPWKSILFVGVIAVIIAGLIPFTTAVAVSSFGTLLYYSVTNICALKLSKTQRMFPASLAMAGLVGCIALGFSLPIEDVVIGLFILTVGLAFRIVRMKVNQFRVSKKEGL